MFWIWRNSPKTPLLSNTVFLCFFNDPISFSSHFYTNKDIDMRSFVMCSGHRVIFFQYYMTIFWDGTKVIKRGKFQVTGCLNVITLSQDVLFFFWQPVYNGLPFLYKWNYWMRSFLQFSWHQVILFDMQYMIRSIVIEISSFMSRGHDYVANSQIWALPLRNDHGIIHNYPRSLYNESF